MVEKGESVCSLPGVETMTSENMDDPTSANRWAMVNDPATPASLLHELLNEVPNSLLERIGEHPRADNVVLAKLAGHADPEVRASVSENANASNDILQCLLRDECPDVRYRMAENANLAVAILQRLTYDENPYVASRAQKTLQRLEMTNCVRAEFSDGSSGAEKQFAP